jgi:hypothetical protein
MYIFGACPPLIPIMMLIPVFFALYIDKKKIDHSITSDINLLIVGGFIGSLVYLGMDFWIDDAKEAFPWNLLQILGIVLPVLFGGLFLYLYGRCRIKSFRFTRGGIGASVLYLVFNAIPFVLPWVIVFTDIRVVMAMLFFPVLFGLWFLLSVSNFTRRYFVAYVILSLLSSLVYAFVLYGFSIQ